MASRLYFLTINLNMGKQGGIDLPGTVDKVRTLLYSYSSTNKCVHKYKVTGEAKIVAVFDVSDVIGLERMVAGLARLGNIDVTCIPLLAYEKFAQMLKVDDKLTKPSTNSVSEDKQLYWLEVTVEYPGMSTEELLDLWAKEATAALGTRESGTHLEPYKVLCERKIHLFAAVEPDELDAMTFTLPLLKKNGSGVQIVSRALQCLEDYSSRVLIRNTLIIDEDASLEY